jgi:uncharacterized protein YcbK (DUF882 family)
VLRRPSPHFTWAEANPHHFPGFSLGVRIQVVKQARAMERLRTAVNKHRAARNKPATGIHVLSWWRPRWYNDQIGGARNSRHIVGDACDISEQEIDRLFPWLGGRGEFDAICNYIFSNGGFGQYPAGSRHVDTRGYRARWTSFHR